MKIGIDGGGGAVKALGRNQVTSANARMGAGVRQGKIRAQKNVSGEDRGSAAAGASVVLEKGLAPGAFIMGGIQQPYGAAGKW